SNFPILNAAQTSNHGAGDGFVTKLNTFGKLAYSTYFGGSAADAGTSIAVTATGVASVAGTTQSYNIPIASLPFAPTCSMDLNHLCNEGFFAQYSPTGALTYSGYLRGAGNAVGLGSTGLAYVAGTANTSFVATMNAYQTTPGGATDGYMEEIDTNKTGSSSLLYATYLGTNGGTGTGVTVDSAGKVYLTTVAQQTATVLKLDITKVGSSAKVYGTTLSSPAHTGVWSPVLDRSGNLFVAGQGLYKVFTKYYPQWFIDQLNSNGVASDYVTSQDGLSFANLAVDALNTVYLVGTTYHSNPGDVMINRYAAALPPVLTIYPNPAIFPKQVLTANPQLNVNIVNRGNITETISNVAISSGFSQINNCTVKLTPGIGCVFLATYNGKQPGVGTGTLTFTSTSYPYQHKVNLFVDAGMPTPSVSPTSLDFGTVPIGQKVSKPVTLTNSGDGNYPLGLIIAPGLSELHDCGTVVKPQTACHLIFTFAPKKLTDVPGTIVINPYPNGSTYLPPQTITTSGKAQ
ncbi:MAG: choice-of-anchor D domain-containing protein, partial [Terriglobales bacterium]